MADTKELPKDIEEGITKFDPTSLKHTETVERNSLPSPEVISQEKTLKNIEDFDKNKLKHAETTEKNPLPNKETIDQEKRLSKS